jgi:hypothetical protein
MNPNGSLVPFERKRVIIEITVNTRTNFFLQINDVENEKRGTVKLKRSHKENFSSYKKSCPQRLFGEK